MNRPIITIIIASLLLALTISPTAWTQGGDPNEPNDTCDVATVVELGTGAVIQGAFDSSGDVDWFTGTVKSNTTYGVFFQFDPPQSGTVAWSAYSGCEKGVPTGLIAIGSLDGWEGGPGGGGPGTPDATFNPGDYGGTVFMSLESHSLVSYHLRVFELGPCAILADVTLDGAVDVQDVAATAAEWRLQVGDPDWDPWFDIDGNQIVNIRDVVLVAKDIGSPCPPPGLP